MSLGSWRGKHLVITAGPTREPLDPVRYLSNESSGRMGRALARAGRQRGARVTLVAGPVDWPCPRGVRMVRVKTARDMARATRAAARTAHAVIGAAAVADWRPCRVATAKHKSHGAPPIIRLTKNLDILKSIARARRGFFPRLAGFALETHHLLDRARRKRKDKHLDLIVANGPSALGGRSTRAWVLTAGGDTIPFRGSKDRLAALILRHLRAVIPHE